MRRPQAYMRARQVLWVGLLMQPSSLRIRASGRATGSRRCFGGRILFFPKQRPAAIQRPAVKELDAAVVGLEGAEGHAPLATPEQVGAHLGLTQFVGRAPVVLGQTANPVEVDALGSGR